MFMHPIQDDREIQIQSQATASGTPAPNKGSFPQKHSRKNKKKERGRWVEGWSRQEVVRVQERKKTEHAISSVISQSGGSSGTPMTQFTVGMHRD